MRSTVLFRLEVGTSKYSTFKRLGITDLTTYYKYHNSGRERLDGFGVICKSESINI